MKIVIPLTISVGLCWLLFTDIDFHEMMSIIRQQCDFRWIALCLVIATASHIFRAFRWGIQLKALGIDTPKKILVYSIFGTYAVNLVFPRLGEVWRTGYVAQRHKAPFSTVFGSMIADRLADSLTVLLLIAVTFFAASKEFLRYIETSGTGYRAIADMLCSPWFWLTTIAIITAFCVLITRRNSNKFILKIQDAMKGLWKGFCVIITMPGRGRWLALTVGVWGCYFIQMYVCFFAFPFTKDILLNHGIVAVLLTFTLTSISMGVPSNGGIGPWQWAAIFALGVYGLDVASASAFANLVLGCNTLLLILLGLFTFIGIAADKKKLNEYKS